VVFIIHSEIDMKDLVSEGRKLQDKFKRVLLKEDIFQDLGMELSPKAKEEVLTNRLSNNPEYINAVQYEWDFFNQNEKEAKSEDVALMLDALRKNAWKNTPTDWAKLHVTEFFANKG
jgi:hypothetical protein